MTRTGERVSNDLGQCVAQVSEPPHHFHSHRCTKRAKDMVGDYEVCGIHARVAKRWEKEGRLDSMVKRWWS